MFRVHSFSSGGNALNTEWALVVVLFVSVVVVVVVQFDLSRRSSKSSSLSISAHSAIDLKRLSVAVALGAVHVWPADRKLNRAFQM